ncbi:hypothetical protein BJ508DRAFT_413452 [Ascobolus immersus RN42]|uniref:Uncharacterized protein n=1 Tax=Ascobolus immersus RN42 TaxID=1160509 RepID=A0A3N4IH37_ASCIM|nr:hypothetical protein BJ508DRAFT_413452 [Ascobolus immersus RN42]
MSLSNPAAVIANAHLNHLFRRQEANLTAPDLSLNPPFQCTLRPDSGQLITYPPGGSEPLQRPPFCTEESPLNQPLLDCVWVPDVDSNITISKARGVGKKECTPLCNMIYDGSYLEEQWKCWEKGCTDAKGKNEEMNKKYIEAVLEFSKESYCKPLGLEGKTEEEDDEKKDGDKDKDDKDSGAGLIAAGKSVLVLATVVGIAFSGLM